MNANAQSPEAAEAEQEQARRRQREEEAMRGACHDHPGAAEEHSEPQ